MKLSGLSLFFPCYNEEANVEGVIRDALRVGPHSADDFEVIIVDDGSGDGTAKLVENYAARDRHVRLIRHSVNKGYGEALKSGFRAARLPWVFYSDGDGQFNLSEIDRLIERTAHADIISGVRVHRADSWHRKLNAKIFELAIGFAMDLHIHDIDSAFKLYKRELFDHMTLITAGALIDAEILIKAKRLGYRIATTPVSHKPRVAGTSTGASPKVILRAMKEFCLLWLDLQKRPRRRK